jgi:hypothetical protein
MQGTDIMPVRGEEKLQDVGTVSSVVAINMEHFIQKVSTVTSHITKSPNNTFNTMYCYKTRYVNQVGDKQFNVRVTATLDLTYTSCQESCRVSAQKR